MIDLLLNFAVFGIPVGIAGWVTYPYYALRVKALSARPGVHVATNKPATYIPPIDETSENGKPNKLFKQLGVKYTKQPTLPPVEDKTFTPPVDGDNKPVQPHSLPFLKNEQITADTIDRSIYIMMMELVNKKALTLLHSDNNKLGFEVTDKHDWLNPTQKKLLEVIKQQTKGRPHTFTLNLLSRIQKRFNKDTITTIPGIKVNLDPSQSYNQRKNVRAGGLTTLLGVAMLPAGMIMGILETEWYLNYVQCLTTGGVLLAGSFPLLSPKPQTTPDPKYVLTLEGTGLLSRVEAFKNYFITTKPDAQYGLERNDLYGELLPWAVAFNQTDQWVNVFAKPLNATSEKIVLNGNIYDKTKLAEAFRTVRLPQPKPVNSIEMISA